MENTNDKYYDLMRTEILDDLKKLRVNFDNTRFEIKDEYKHNGFELDIRHNVDDRQFYRGKIHVDIENMSVNVKGEFITKYSDNSMDLEPLLRIDSNRNQKIKYRFFNTHILNLYDSEKREELKLTEKGFDEDNQEYSFEFPNIIDKYFIENYVSETIYDSFYNIYKIIRNTKAIKLGQYEIYAYLDFMQYMCRKFADVQHLLNIAHSKYKDELHVENKLSVNNYFIKMMKKYSKEKLGFYRIPESLEKIKVLSRLGSEIDVNSLYIIQDDEAVELYNTKFKYALEFNLYNGDLHIELYEKEGDKPYTAFYSIGHIDISSASPTSIDVSTYLRMNNCRRAKLKSNFKGQKPYLKTFTTMRLLDDEIDFKELTKVIELDKKMLGVYNNTDENLYSYRVTVFQAFIVGFLQYIIDNDLGNLRNMIYGNLNLYNIITTNIKFD